MKKTENKSGKSGMQVMKKLMAFIGNYKIFLGLSIVLAAVTVILQLYILVTMPENSCVKPSRRPSDKISVSAITRLTMSPELC